jgi:hypothetical protein
MVRTDNDDASDMNGGVAVNRLLEPHKKSKQRAPKKDPFHTIDTLILQTALTVMHMLFLQQRVEAW